VKRIIVITAVVLASLAVGWDAVEFAGGYSAFPIVLPFLFLPASFLLLALTFLASCAAAIVMLVALARRQWWLAVVLIGMLGISWLFSPWFLGRPAFLLGFATRLRMLSSPAEIRLASATCLSLMPNGGQAFGPGRVSPDDQKEESKRVWAALSQLRFVHLLDDTCAVFVDPPSVEFSWGGALPGHWGIYVLASNETKASSQYLETLRFSDKIVLFRGH
jgi:hypothetical protein